MTRVPRTHPRYASLRTRAQMAREVRSGLVVPEGLIAHGRGEAFDYLLGERTSPSARRAIRAAARWVANARFPVLSVNGNVAALAAAQVAAVQRRLPRLVVEVNLFHRTPARVRAVARALGRAGTRRVRGLRPTVRVPGLASDRGRVDAEGMARADVVIVPLEDGDRAEALHRWGRRVISIDLNPLSRTSRAADIPIIDELSRALTELARVLPEADRRRRPGIFPRFDRDAALRGAQATIARNLNRLSKPPGPRTPPARRSSGRPARETAHPNGRRR